MTGCGQAVVAEPAARDAALARWAQAPGARVAHPREEHLLPLMVMAGAAGPDRGRVAFHDTFGGLSRQRRALRRLTAARASYVRQSWPPSIRTGGEASIGKARVPQQPVALGRNSTENSYVSPLVSTARPRQMPLSWRER